MKILHMLSYIDLKHRVGCIPLFWQLIKNFHEKGVDNIVIPYAGQSVESLWWKAEENPALFYFKLEQKLRKIGLFQGSRNIPTKLKTKIGFREKLANILVAPKWYRKIKQIIIENDDLDTIILYNIPLNHMIDFPRMIRELRSDIKLIFYDGDMPVHLPSFGGFSTGYNPLVSINGCKKNTRSSLGS